MRKAAAIFSILMGVMMSGTWGCLLVTEGPTPAALIIAGYGVLTHRPWAPALLLVAPGELI